MLRLVPEIQQHILLMPDAVRRPALTECALRPIAQIENTRGQADESQERFRSASVALAPSSCPISGAPTFATSTGAFRLAV